MPKAPDANDILRTEGAEGLRLIFDRSKGEEEIRDPLDGLVEKTATDPGAPFVPDVLERLAALKKNDRSAFEALRSQLKKAGCRVAALDEAIAAENGETGGRGPTQADILIELASAAGLFHAPDGTGFADLDIRGHRETWPIRSRGFRRWLARCYFEATQGAPNSEALQSTLNVIEAKAHFDAPERVVHVRVGGLDGRLYLDLSDDTWRAAEIDAAGWRVIENPPVRFRRAAGMLPLPMPARSGSANDLQTFLNVESDAEFTLAVAWALAALRDRGPYPVLVVAGEHGSAKSSFVRILRRLIDPSSALLRALPRSDRDLFISACNQHVLAFDNVSGLPEWCSDTLCRLATGGGFATRELYTDVDEILFNAERPIALNGIEDVVTRPDLADCAIMLTLMPIPDDKRRTEDDLEAEFDAAHPAILGALLDAVSCGLRRLPSVKLAKLPRMADFATWATACEGELGLKCTFEQAYEENLAAAMERHRGRPRRRGGPHLHARLQRVATQLLRCLGEAASDTITRAKHWPQAPHILSRRLRRAATFLRKTGIDVDLGGRDGHESSKQIHITKPAAQAAVAPQAEPASVLSDEIPF